MNSVTLIGRITKDLELKRTNGGKAVCSFCLAVDAGKDKAYFIDCVAWEGKAEQLAGSVKKGDKIGVSGILTTRTWEDNEGSKRKATEVNVFSFDYCSNKVTEKSAEESAPQADLPEAAGLPFEI